MPHPATTGRTPASRGHRPRVQPFAWKLEDAKARFSEVVRRARTEGPQRVTVRGKDAVVVIAVETLEKLLPPEQPRQTLVAFLQGLGIGDLDLTREHDTGRDIIV
jgi:prevent-host-death family protein